MGVGILSRLKWIFNIVFFLILSFFAFSNIVFEVPSVIYSEDRNFTLKDIFPEIVFDRTISYIPNNKIVYSLEELSKTLNGLLSSYYKDFELIFEGDIVTIIYEKENPPLDTETINLVDFVKEAIKDFDDSLIINNIDLNNAPTTVKSCEIQRIYRNGARVYLTVKVVDLENRTRYLSIIADVSKYENVLVYNKEIPRGTILSTELTEVATKNILELNYQPVNLELIKSGNYELTKNVEKGEIVNSIYLRKLPDINAGDIVTVVVDFNGVQVSTLSRVMSNANFGEFVSARNLDNGNIVSGKLMQGPILLVDLGGWQNE
jgi:flagella basal body P-ring formation protein FlgA